MPEYVLADIFADDPELPEFGPRRPRPVPRGTPGVYQPGGPPAGVPTPYALDGFPNGNTGNLSGPFSGEAFTPDGQPTDAFLDRIRFIESGGNDMAVSHAGAQGPYQIMPDAAVDPGFGVTPMLDPLEAFDPKRSREWARQYLAAMYRRYQNPALAAAAYNAGPGRIDSALAAGGDFYARLPAETQGYIRKAGVYGW